MYSRNTKTTNEPTASNNKSEKIIGEHLGLLKDLETSKYKRFFSLKDLDISKYKRESKARMPIQFYCLILLNCGLFSFLNIKSVKI
jgi:hypothetical protein